MYHDCLRIPNESILRAFRKMHDGDRSLFIGENFIEFILSFNKYFSYSFRSPLLGCRKKILVRQDPFFIRHLKWIRGKVLYVSKFLKSRYTGIFRFQRE